jgi:hypothetical protein
MTQETSGPGADKRNQGNKESRNQAPPSNPRIPESSNPVSSRPLDDSFQIELLTPEGVLLQDRAEEVVVPGREGYFGVLRGHEYFATTLKPGILTVKRQDKRRCYRVSGGVVQVTPEKVIVCAENAALTDVEHR